MPSDRPHRNLNHELCKTTYLRWTSYHIDTREVNHLKTDGWKEVPNHMKHRKAYTLKGIQLRPLTKLRLIGERDAEKSSRTMRFIGLCCIRKRLLAEHRRRRVKISMSMRPEDRGDQPGLWTSPWLLLSKIGGLYSGNGRIRR